MIVIFQLKKSDTELTFFFVFDRITGNSFDIVIANTFIL